MFAPKTSMAQTCQAYSLCVVPVSNDPFSNTRTFKLVLEIPSGQLTSLNAVNFVMSISNTSTPISMMNVTQFYQGPPNVPLSLGIGGSQIALSNIAAMNGAIISSLGQPLDLFQVTFVVAPGECAEVSVSGFSQVLIPVPGDPLGTNQQCFPSSCSSGPVSYTECLSLLSISGFAQTIPPAQCYGTLNSGLDDANIRLIKTVSGVELNATITDNAGTYVLSNVQSFPSGFHTLAADKSDNPICGVNAYDLSQLNLHVLSTASLSDYGQLFAADMDQNDVVSTVDVVYMRRLLQGEDPGENFSSWRFKIESGFAVYANATPPPFLSTLPGIAATYLLPSLEASLQNMGFIGIKSGDIDRSCTDCSGNQRPGSEQVGGAYTDTAPVLLRIPAKAGLKAGDHFRIPVFIDEDVSLSALLLSLSFDATSLGNLSLAAGQITDVDQQEPYISTGHLRWAWVPMAQPFMYNNSLEPLIYIEGEALRDIPVGKPLFTAFGSELVEEDQQLRPCMMVDGTTAVQATPNPFTNEVQLSMNLSTTMPLVVTFYGANGQLIDQYQLQTEPGQFTWTWPEASLAPRGVIFYRIDTPEGSLHGKLIKQ